MEAKDTLASIDDLLIRGIDFNKPIGEWLNKALEAQAEISFKAGEEEEYKKWVKAFMKVGVLIAEADTVGIAIEEIKRAGTREMVEWIITRFESYHGNPVHTVEWETKLKEWGIDD